MSAPPKPPPGRLASGRLALTFLLCLPLLSRHPLGVIVLLSIAAYLILRNLEAVVLLFSPTSPTHSGSTARALGRRLFQAFAAMSFACIAGAFGRSAESDYMKPVLMMLIIAAPCAILFGGVTLLACQARARRLDRDVGRCERCRYDLTGLKGAICPECGHTSERAYTSC